jgi:hypothetical protein
MNLEQQSQRQEYQMQEEEALADNDEWAQKKSRVIRSNRWVCEGRGYLHKQGSHHGGKGRWSLRFFTLQGGNLFYYASHSAFESGARPRGLVPLGSMEFTIKEDLPDELYGDLSVELFACGCCGPQINPDNVFYIQTKQRSYHMHAPSHSDKELWLQALRGWQSKRLLNPDPHTGVDRLEWRRFLQTAKTGDLLLFRGQGRMPNLQRTITGAEYDHVAIVLEDKTGKLHIFESVGGEGVSTIQMEAFVQMGYYSVYDKVALRRLSPPLTASQTAALDKFVQDEIGKQYKLNFRKLSRQTEKEYTEYSGYFCSELVAAAYKAIGLLHTPKPASKFWPGSFAAVRNLKLQGNQLGNEQIVLFR